jgi:prepilin-type N-terminal cleavage/methylation domain-containing protein
METKNMKKFLTQFVGRLQSGFTLVETLVAIAILMVSIAGPLDIANKGLVTAVGSRDQTIAAYLAQDTIEFIKNIRDDNLTASPVRGWLATPSSSVLDLSSCTSLNTCSVETAVEVPNNPTTVKSTYNSSNDNCNFSGSTIILGTLCHLYIDTTDTTNGYYTYKSASGSNQPTQFYRSFYLTQLNSGNYLVTVSVYWANGTLLNKVILQSVIFNTTR